MINSTKRYKRHTLYLFINPLIAIYWAYVLLLEGIKLPELMLSIVIMTLATVFATSTVTMMIVNTSDRAEVIEVNESFIFKIFTMKSMEGSVSKRIGLGRYVKGQDCLDFKIFAIADWKLIAVMCNILFILTVHVILHLIK